MISKVLIKSAKLLNLVLIFYFSRKFLCKKFIDFLKDFKYPCIKFCYVVVQIFKFNCIKFLNLVYKFLELQSCGLRCRKFENILVKKF